MSDAILEKRGEVWDFAIGPDGDILTAEFFDTAILVSLFGERRAAASEVSDAALRRGWIGNESNAGGFEQGSKLWLYNQARVTRSALNDIGTTAEAALRWLVDDGYAKHVRAEASSDGTRVVLSVVITRYNSQVERRFYTLWNNSGITEG